MVVIPPEDAKVVIPTDLNVSLTSKPFKISTAALTSRFDAKVETPATVRPSPIFTFFPIPIPPLTIRAPFAVVVEFSVLENVCPFTHSEPWLPQLLPPDNASSNRLPGREPAPFYPEHAASPAAYKPVNHRDQLPITALPHSSVAIPPKV